SGPERGGSGGDAVLLELALDQVQAVEAGKGVDLGVDLAGLSEAVGAAVEVTEQVLDLALGHDARPDDAPEPLEGEPGDLLGLLGPGQPLPGLGVVERDVPGLLPGD